MLFLYLILSFSDIIDPIQISQNLAQGVIDQSANQSAEKQLAQLNPDLLLKTLDNDQKKKAFWINVYNGLIYNQLSENPSLYEDRNNFFSNKSMIIAGEELSFDDIEHDILRKSTWKYSFGYLPNIFSGNFESSHEVEALDPRIHFALNCGAKSCPTVKVYDDKKIEAQLDNAAKFFLISTTILNDSNNEVSVTSLMNWFRGDFGDKKGILNMLVKYGIIAPDSQPSIQYLDYDWTLYLNNHE